MKPTIVAGIFALSLFLLLPLQSVDAHSGCCSWHQGVCGCGCCDGTPLSSTCAQYYPDCSSGAGTTTSNQTSISTQTDTPIPTFSPQVYTPIPTRSFVIYPTHVIKATKTPTFTPTPTPTPKPTKTPTPKSTQKVVRAIVVNKPSQQPWSIWTFLFNLFHF